MESRLGATEFRFGGKKGLLEDKCLRMIIRNMLGKDQDRAFGLGNSKCKNVGGVERRPGWLEGGGR